MIPILQASIDRQAIAELLYLYCRGCDRADEVLLRACFHPDSMHRHGGFDGASSDFIGFAMKIIRRAMVTKHMLTNIVIELDGDTAYVESHYTAYHRNSHPQRGTQEDQLSAGRYLDRFERRDGSWRIAARIGLIDYERLLAPTERAFAELPAAARSQRFPDDALYRVVGIERRTP